MDACNILRFIGIYSDNIVFFINNIIDMKKWILTIYCFLFFVLSFVFTIKTHTHSIANIGASMVLSLMIVIILNVLYDFIKFLWKD